MEDLTMLVQLAGGEMDTTRRLKEAGFRTVAELAEGDPDDVRQAGGLTAAAARRLIQAARKQLAGPDPEHKRKSPLKRGLVQEAEEPPSPRRRSKRRREKVRAETAHKSTATGLESARTDPGVSPEESLALTGGTPKKSRTENSFWKFG